MTTQTPIVITVAALARLAGVSHHVIIRQTAAGEIQPLVRLNEGERIVPLFDPATALIVAELLHNHNHPIPTFS